jgi:hypothetical protein
MREVSSSHEGGEKMASEIHVLFRGALPHLKALSREMGELGFPFTIRYSNGSLEEQRGFMPMRLRRAETGVEFDVFDGRAAVEELAGKDVDPAFDRSGNFRWSGDDEEMLAGLCAAAALARLVDGAVFEEQEARLLSADEAIALARQTLQSTLKTGRPRRPGTRPTDIKRYLKPLLKERSDLVLVDRLLLIRPVRHILRGVLFDRTSDKYCFRIHRYVQDLSQARGSGGIGYGGYFFGPRWHVWQPHFEPALMDVLAEDVFERVGKITTLSDLADFIPDEGRFFDSHVTALLLAGERDRALEYVRQIENRDPKYWAGWAEANRAFLAQDIAAICASFHAREATAARALKIEHIWEPSPFPVELAIAERVARSGEPLFVPKPWIPRPAGLLQEMPEQVGDVRYAKDWLRRNDRKILVATLSREQAEDRHRNSEPYVLAARLSGGAAVLLCRDGEERESPSRFPGYDSRGDLRIELHGLDSVVEAKFYEAMDDDGTLESCSIEVFKHSIRGSLWHWSFGRREGEEWIHDHRGGRLVTRNKLTSADAGRLKCPKPDFGEFDTQVAMVLAVLRSRGYGEAA